MVSRLRRSYLLLYIANISTDVARHVTSSQQDGTSTCTSPLSGWSLAGETFLDLVVHDALGRRDFLVLFKNFYIAAAMARNT